MTYRVARPVQSYGIGRRPTVSLTATLPPAPLGTWQTRTPYVPGPLDLQSLVPADDWARLPRALRARFTVGHGPAAYHGTMEFQASRIGCVFAWLTRPLGAPLVSTLQAPVHVTVRPVPGGVEWVRQLGTRIVRSVKSQGPGNTVLERTEGGLGMVLEVTAEPGALVFTSTSFLFGRLRIPTLLTPGRCRVEHRAIDATRFRFTLTMTHPLWGETFRQTGVFQEYQP